MSGVSVDGGPAVARRDWFRFWLRQAAAAGLIAGGWGLARRSVGLDRTRHRCVGTGVCRGCRELGGCLHPQAQFARAAGGQDRRRP